MERKVEAPGDAYSSEKMMGGSHLQIYKKPVVENQGINSKISIAKSDTCRSRKNSLKLKQCLV